MVGKTGRNVRPPVMGMSPPHGGRFEVVPAKGTVKGVP
ncbi:hypothetical protein ASZ90_002969 [hydrocarbon metagenome]|uniref:Uncharacterized protein n=1 Tax=hydrocarbon metagenome TaxID=938273 RepID=A0A0W8G202_9ZZZZ